MNWTLQQQQHVHKMCGLLPLIATMKYLCVTSLTLISETLVDQTELDKYSPIANKQINK